MNYNLLLEYLSEIGSGKWSQFKEAVRYLAQSDTDELSPSKVALRLSMLGHVEFGFDHACWSISPPTFAWLDGSQVPHAVLCGKRTAQLLKHLEQRAKALNVRIDRRPQEYGPDALLLKAPSLGIAEQLATECGMYSEPQAANVLVQCLPTLGSYLAICPEAREPIGYEMKVYDPAVLKWSETQHTDNEGLYWFECFWPEYRLKVNGRTLQVSRDIGIYGLLQHTRSKVLRYIKLKQQVLVPEHAMVPPLYARALTLCSGLLPAIENVAGRRTCIFSNVPEQVSNFILSGLSQESQETL